MLLINRSKDLWKIIMFNWWTVVSIFFDLQLPPLAPNIFSCLSNHLGAAFFFSLLLLSSVICPLMASWRQFLFRIWPSKLAFLLKIIFTSVLSYTAKNLFISYFLWPFYFHSPPAPHFKALQILTFQCS